jgi:hypothetical protein
MRKLLTLLVLGLVLVALSAASAIASPSASPGNPNGTGQPTQSCQAEPTGPPGITSTTNGFATKAVTVYAGTQSQNSKNSHSVSQYDVACYQVSTHH